ncbi:DUF2165 domain-containing protein [Amycolatopsis nigrescens]|uniref:DUF2165 domain-containing protein n=1 Tax=Amycolatopsis nigrescens TaxID=381445 RepID=UPI00036070C2|nr:DUF2165 domain-containing protein [Amycolatopsis nigrescens]
MRLLYRLGGLSVVVAALTVITAVQMTLIVVGNITDFGTNQEFVQHVLAMDTTFRSPDTMWRAIESPGLANTAYLAIIVWEALCALVLLAACVAWVRAFTGRAPGERARRLASLGWLMQLVLFAGGFLVIGGEWFQMWQSEKWNGLESALRNVLVAGVALVLVHLPERRREA